MSNNTLNDFISRKPKNKHQIIDKIISTIYYRIKYLY